MRLAWYKDSDPPRRVGSYVNDVGGRTVGVVLLIGRRFVPLSWRRMEVTLPSG